MDSRNHVCHFEPDGRRGSIEFAEIGWRKATTFPGFCSKHDSEVFRAVEHSGFDGSHEQCVLQAYRNACNELYRKTALVESLELQRDIVDRGFDLNSQIDIQLSMRQALEGQRHSRNELRSFVETFEVAVLKHQYDRFSSKVIWFDGPLSVVSSAVTHVQYDFSGNHLIDTWDLDSDAEFISHAIMATEKGGAIVFCWPKDHLNAGKLVSSFDGLGINDKADVFVQYCFLNSEMTYFARSWWDALEPAQRKFISKLTRSIYYEGGAFEPCTPRLVSWRIRQKGQSPFPV